MITVEMINLISPTIKMTIETIININPDVEYNDEFFTGIRKHCRDQYRNHLQEIDDKELNALIGLAL